MTTPNASQKNAWFIAKKMPTTVSITITVFHKGVIRVFMESPSNKCVR